MRTLSRPLLTLVLALTFAGCGDNDDHDHDHNEADRFGVGAQCASDEDCEDHLDEGTGDTGELFELSCLPQFSGGYCGLEDCLGNEDCPEASACVAHDDGQNYCFRRCQDKSECNVNRDPEVESNCSSNIEFVEPTSGKACVPPSAGG